MDKKIYVGLSNDGIAKLETSKHQKIIRKLREEKLLEKNEK